MGLNPKELDQQKAHDVIVKNFHDMPGKPYLDKKTIMEIENMTEHGQKIAAIKDMYLYLDLSYFIN